MKTIGKTTLAFLLGLAGGAQAADLMQVYRDALSFDAQFAAARAQLEAGRERIPQGRAGLLPSLSLSANTTYNDAEVRFRGGGLPTTDRSFNSNAYQLQLTQPVFRWQNWVQYDQAKLQVVQAEALYESSRQDLIVRVAQAYFDVLLAEFSLQVARSQKEAISQQLEQAKKNFEVGVATITDTHEAQARYDLAVAGEIAAESDLEVRRHALRVIIGQEPEGLKPLAADVTITRPQPESIQKWVESAESANYAVQFQQAAADVAAKEIERSRAGHYPTLDAVATYGRSATGASLAGATGVGNETTAGTIGLQFALPLYQGGAVSSREREAAALRDKALQDLEAARRSAAQSARQAYVGVTSGLAQVSALKAAVVSSESALESNKLGYEVGVRINIDVLNAQQQLSSTRRDLARATYDTLIAQLRLKQAAGTLAEEDVAALNALLR
jgi:outer membrane protein